MKEIDYERACRRGIYSRKCLNNDKLDSLTLDELESILNLSNDEVVHLHRQFKDKDWAVGIPEQQLYQVLHCFSEDKLFFKDRHNFALIELKLEQLKNQSMQSRSTDSYIGDMKAIALDSAKTQ